jgi:hypothetical protein
MNSRFAFVYPLVVAALAASCGYSLPYQTSGPALSKEGVQIAIAGDRCYVNRSGEQFPTTVDDDELHLNVNLQVKNESNHVASLSPERIQLVESKAGERIVMHPHESGAISLAPGETRSVSLDFDQQGELDCHHGLALEAPGAVAVEGTQIALNPIQFRPSR